MKKSKLIYTAIAAALLAGAISASAQSDSSNVPALRGNPIVRLTLQERETPVVNNITQVTQNIVQTAAPSFIPTSSGYIFAVSGYIHSEGSGPWMINGGHRACQSFGYGSGYVAEYSGGGALVACYSN